MAVLTGQSDLLKACGRCLAADAQPVSVLKKDSSLLAFRQPVRRDASCALRKKTGLLFLAKADRYVTLSVLGIVTD